MIKPGDLLFVWGHDLLERTIERITHGPSHVAMFVNENTVCEAQGGRTVGECDLSFYLNSGATLEVWSDPRLYDEQRQRMVDYARKLYGSRYDYLLIMVELLRFECGLSVDWYRNKGHFICAGYMDEISMHEGIMWTNVKNPAPVDLLQYGALRKICELGQRESAG